MTKTLFTISFILAVCICSAQVKIGYNPNNNVNPAAILELSNNIPDNPASWKSLIPPQVNFSNQVFTSNYVWGIAGTPSDGALVFNIGETYTNGFSGPGIYCWLRNSWSPVNIMVTDRIRLSLTSSIAAYDAAPVNSWVNVTSTEYTNLLSIVNGAARYATPEIYMNTSAGGGWSANYTIGGSNNASKVPASNYIIAWSVRTGSAASSSLGSKLKVGTSQFSGYTDYGTPLPNIGSITVNSRVFFVLKAPNIITPPLPCYTAVYNAFTYFLGNNSNSGAGPEYYDSGDSPSPSIPLSSDSYSQVISTPQRQW